MVYTLCQYVERRPNIRVWRHVGDFPTLEEAERARAEIEGCTRLHRLHDDGRLENLDRHAPWPGVAVNSTNQHRAASPAASRPD